MKLRKLAALSAALMITFTGCAVTPDETVSTDAAVTSEVTSEKTEKTTAAETTTAKETTAAEAAAPEVPVTTENAVKAIALSNYPDVPDGGEEYGKLREENATDPEFTAMLSGFADRISDKLINSDKENAAVSPASIFTAMSILARSADGASEKEIYTLLTGSEPTEQTESFIGSGCGRFMRLINMQRDAEIMVANSLWLTDVYDFNEDFLSDTARDYYVESYAANFSGNPLGVGKEMSHWVSDHTNDMIKPEFKPDDNTVMYILNAVYLKSSWQHKFSPELTEKGDFTLSDGSKVTCDFMNNTYNSVLVKGDNYTAAPLWATGGITMHFILPDEGVSTSDLLSKGDIFSEVLSARLDSYMVEYKIPKFSFDTEAGLIDTFKEMGVTSCFVPSEDFAELCNTANKMYVSDIKHGSRISIDENGLEAAAYTAVAVTEESEPPHAEFTLDRPFLFMIEYCGNILFMGVVNNPTAE